MSETVNAPVVIIKPKHQSAPKEHWADKEVQKAAEDIDSGRFIPDTAGKAELNKLGLALRYAPEEILQQTPTLEDFQHTRNLNEIAQHPRVLEAMERLKLEIEDTHDDQELIEKSWELRELNEQSASGNKWGGQERWEGKDAEEMRRGRIMSPVEFYERLCKVIGNERVLKGPAMEHKPGAQTGRAALVIRNPHWRGYRPGQDSPAVQARQLREDAEKELKVAKSLRSLGRDDEAKKHCNKAFDMSMAAGTLLMESIGTTAEEQREFIRVATVQWPLSTEWMMMNFDQFGVPTTAKFLGWRTALLTMVRRRVITEEEAHEAFPVGSGPAASWYLEQLQLFRNTGVGLVN